jgi:hypothetical protein
MANPLIVAVLRKKKSQRGPSVGRENSKSNIKPARPPTPKKRPAARKGGKGGSFGESTSTSGVNYIANGDKATGKQGNKAIRQSVDQLLVSLDTESTDN